MHTSLRTLGSTTIAVVVLLIKAQMSLGQGTTFTYQGQLKSGGSPADGNFNMTFRIFDDALAGVQYGSDQVLPAVPVETGLFTVNLDFGTGIFDLPGRWLEIEVDGEILSPRQELTSTPFCQTALYALSGPSGSSPWQTNGSDVWYGGGGVGIIGGSSPFPSGKGVFLEGGNTSRANVFAWNYDAGSALSLVLNAPGGNVGIGTIAPTAKLHVANSSGNTILTTTSGGRGLSASATSNFGGTGVYGEHTAALNSGSLGTLDAGVTGVAQVSVNYGGNFINADSAGIALRSQGLLDIVKTGDGAELLRLSTERPWVFRQTATGSGANLELHSTVGVKNFIISALGGTPVATFWANDADPRVGIGTNAPQAMLDVNGTMRTKVLTITGADVAEKFPSTDEQVEPGTVMEIDPNHAGKLRISRGDYCHRVAGVVSGAGDIPVGAILGNMDGQENSPAVALSGRVWVKCDASVQSIQIGDQLTTSTTAGHAMKAVDRDRANGAIIGKAMTPLARGQRGLVLVLVNLQ